jgi:uncharacterized protein YwgA
MDRQQIGLKLTLDSLGLSARLNTFAERLILQKATYLAQAAGVQLGYHYNWYLRGPYSPSLTRDAFAVADEVARNSDDLAGWSLDTTSKQRLRQLAPLLDKKRQDTEAFARHLELLASIHFLWTNRGADLGAADLKTILKRYGKDFTEKQIQEAVQELTAHGLRPGRSSQ